MRITSNKPEMDAEQVRNYLQANTDSFGVFLDLDRILEYIAHFSFLVKERFTLLSEIAGYSVDGLTKRDQMQPLLSKIGVLHLCGKNEDEYSFSHNVRMSILERDDVSDVANQVIEMCEEISQVSTLLSSLRKYSQLPLSRELSNEKHRMVIAHPIWSILNTQRFSAREPAIQNISKALADLIVPPRGYQVVFSDSGQIEPRITYSHFIPDKLIRDLIILYDDAYFGILHFLNLTQAQEIALRNGEPLVKMEVTDEIKAMRQSLKKLMLSGTYGSSMGTQDPVLASKLTAKIVNHPLRLQWLERIEEEVNRGSEVFYTAFGDPIYPGDTQKYKKGSPGWSHHLINCGINNPIQGTAAKLMLFSVSRARQLQREYSDVHIAMYKHDEGCFYIPENNTEIIPKLQDCLSYEYQDWIPIRSDLQVGKKTPSAKGILKTPSYLV